MDPIPYFYESVNRNAIVVTPKKPLFEWINTLYPESPVSEDNEGTVYLVREHDHNGQINQWLQKNYEQIFINELNNWHTNEADWPHPRTWQLFAAWFTIQIASMVLDLEEEGLEKE